MAEANTRHSQVFESPVPFADGRTVYPPEPDSDGHYLMSELMDWFDFMDWAYDANRRVCLIFGSNLGSMSAHDASRAAACIGELELLMRVLTSRHPKMIPTQQFCKDLCAMLLGQLLVYRGDVPCLQIFSRHIVGSPDKWEALSLALVENELSGHKDWRHATSPAKWVKSTANNIAAKESVLNKHAVDPSTNREKLSLEEVAELPGQVVIERTYDQRSLAELEAAAKEDSEIAEYLALKIRCPHWRRVDIWAHLGWDDERGERIDRRFRRLRNQIRAIGAGIQCRDYRPAAGLSAASCTAYFEPLWDGAKGSRSGVWQHHNPYRNEE
jgi:hypothetical protein